MEPITTPEVLAHMGLASPAARAFVVATGVGVAAYATGFPKSSFTDDGEMRPFALLSPGPHATYAHFLALPVAAGVFAFVFT